jgi:quercetin dioxygenase-like cupin family protein
MPYTQLPIAAGPQFTAFSRSIARAGLVVSWLEKARCHEMRLGEGAMKKRTVLIASVAAALAGNLSIGLAQKPPAAHVALTAAEMEWGAPPPSLSPGAKFAAVSGDPAGKGPFVIRLQLPAGYKIAPHWHPTDEHVTVVSGAFALGMGETFDEKSAKELQAGGYALLPSAMRHFAFAKSDAVVQVHGMGPFVFNYVNPADDPSRKGK